MCVGASVAMTFGERIQMEVPIEIMKMNHVSQKKNPTLIDTVHSYERIDSS